RQQFRERLIVVVEPELANLSLCGCSDGKRGRTAKWFDQTTDVFRKLLKDHRRQRALASLILERLSGDHLGKAMLQLMRAKSMQGQHLRPPRCLCEISTTSRHRIAGGDAPAEKFDRLRDAFLEGHARLPAEE